MNRKAVLISSIAVGFMGGVVMTMGGMLQIDPMIWVGTGVLSCSFVAGCASRFIPVEATMKRNKSDSTLNLAIEAEAEAAAAEP